jgi:hypothetical protein
LTCVVLLGWRVESQVDYTELARAEKSAGT